MMTLKLNTPKSQIAVAVISLAKAKLQGKPQKEH